MRTSSKRYREYGRYQGYWWMATANDWRRGHTSRIRPDGEFLHRPECLKTVLQNVARGLITMHWQQVGEAFWRNVEVPSWKIVKTLDIGYVVDHPSVPYPRLEYVLLEQAMEAGNLKIAEWQKSQSPTVN